MNSLLYYYNNVQKMAAYRQAKRMQRGVKLGHEQPIMSASTTKFVSARISIKVSDFSIEFYGNTYGSYTIDNQSIFNQSQPYTYGEGFLSVYQTKSGAGGIEWILFEKPATGAALDDSINLRYKPIEPFEKFHFVITRQGTTVKVYINGELKATKEHSEVKDMGELQLAIANSSDVGFVRVWNYSLSADDVTAHYNNGDPMGYVVPKAERGIDYSVELTGTRTYTWDAENTSYLAIVPASPMYLGRMYKVNITVSNYETGTPFIYDTKYKVPAQNGTYDIVVKNISAIANRVYIYGGLNNLVRRLTLTVNSVTPVGLLAEYLPQNLMYGNDNKIAVSWLDSAKQLPLSDEYMEPLFQSIGGYDMAANGAPEILYNE